MFSPSVAFSVYNLPIRCNNILIPFISSVNEVCQRGLELDKLFLDFRFADTRDASVSEVVSSFRTWMSTYDTLDKSEKCVQIYETFLPQILNLSLTCPYKIIRDSMAALLEEIRQWGKVEVPAPLHQGSSFFIPESEVGHMYSTESMWQFHIEHAHMNYRSELGIDM